MRFSQSLLDKADNCMRSMQFAIEDPQYRGGIVRAVGTAYHAGLEYLYRQRMPTGLALAPTGVALELLADSQRNLIAEMLTAATEALEYEIAESGDAFIWDDKFPTFVEAIAAVEAMLTTYVTGGHPFPDDDWEVVGVETPFDLPHGDITISSRGIDLTLRHRTTGWFLGVDHKTANRMWDQNKHHPRKKAQGPLYLWAMSQLWPEAPGYQFVFDVMTYAGKFERRIANATPDQIEAALQRMAGAAFLYTKMRENGIDLPANPTSTLCSPKYCDFWDQCPFGASLDTPLHSAA